MPKQHTLRLAGIILALLTVVFAARLFGWAASDDTPIVIGDGSLTIESRNVPWRQYTGTGDQRGHPHTAKSVTQVLVNVAGVSHPLSFANQECLVDVTYLSAHVVLATGPNGKGITFRPFSLFHETDPTHLAHNDPSGKISHVTVTRAGARVFDSDAKGGTTITIIYK